MKTFLRKLKLSFLAMLCGWIACNIAWWVGMLTEVHFDEIRIQDAQKILFLGAATGVVIFAAWMIIFLPVDLLVPEYSAFRRPVIATICGFVVGCCVILIPLAWHFWEYNLSHHSQIEFHWESLPLILSPGVTGMVAAYVRSKDRNPLLKKP